MNVSLTHWLVVIAMVAVFAVPIARILGHLGLSRAWTAAAFVPIVNIIALWLLAFASWPRLKDTSVNAQG